MNDEPQHGEQQKRPENQPAINLPPIVTATIAALVLVHVYLTYLADQSTVEQSLLQFGYLPLREMLPENLSGGRLNNFYSLFSHAFLHANWTHLFFNTAWLAVFGSPIARRYGVIGFGLVFLIGSAAGALLFELMTSGEFTVLLGASGAVSALIGGALRFMFQPVQTAIHPETGEVIILGRKLAGISELLRNQRTFSFAAFWLGINLLFGMMPGLLGVNGAIAWQAHLGGFIAGFFMVAWLERRWF